MICECRLLSHRPRIQPVVWHRTGATTPRLSYTHVVSNPRLDLPLPLATRPAGGLVGGLVGALLALLAALLARVEDPVEHVEAEVGKIEAEGAELALGLVAQHVAALAPEGRDGPADGGVVARRARVHVARVRDLPLGRARHPVHLGVRQRLQLPEPQLLRQRVHARVPQQALARVVVGLAAGRRLAALGLGALARGRTFAGARPRRHALQAVADAPREVLARVQVLQERADGVLVLGRELDAPRRRVRAEGGDGRGEEGRALQQRLVRAQHRRRRLAADGDLHHRRLEVAGRGAGVSGRVEKVGDCSAGTAAATYSMKLICGAASSSSSPSAFSPPSPSSPTPSSVSRASATTSLSSPPMVVSCAGREASMRTSGDAMMASGQWGRQGAQAVCRGLDAGTARRTARRLSEGAQRQTVDGTDEEAAETRGGGTIAAQEKVDDGTAPDSRLELPATEAQLRRRADRGSCATGPELTAAWFRHFVWPLTAQAVGHRDICGCYILGASAMPFRNF